MSTPRELGSLEKLKVIELRALAKRKKISLEGKTLKKDLVHILHRDLPKKDDKTSNPTSPPSKQMGKQLLTHKEKQELAKKVSNKNKLDKSGSEFIDDFLYKIFQYIFVNIGYGDKAITEEQMSKLVLKMLSDVKKDFANKIDKEGTKKASNSIDMKEFEKRLVSMDYFMHNKDIKFQSGALKYLASILETIVIDLVEKATEKNIYMTKKENILGDLQFRVAMIGNEELYFLYTFNCESCVSCEKLLVKAKETHCRIDNQMYFLEHKPPSSSKKELISNDLKLKIAHQINPKIDITNEGYKFIDDFLYNFFEYIFEQSSETIMSKSSVKNKTFKGLIENGEADQSEMSSEELKNFGKRLTKIGFKNMDGDVVRYKRNFSGLLAGISWYLIGQLLMIANMKNKDKKEEETKYKKPDYFGYSIDTLTVDIVELVLAVSSDKELKEVFDQKKT